MSAEAEEYVRLAEESMQALIDARAALMETTARADKILESLDKAANVLQSKYRRRKIERNLMMPEYVDDPNEWKNHAFRYGSSGAFRLIEYRKDGNKNTLTTEAWRASDRASYFETTEF